jgi:DsbC/DsbD-like thiol-disulfide interchange protein
VAFRLRFFVLLGLLIPGTALAQADGPLGPSTVSWSVQPAAASQGGVLKLTLNGTVAPGWHVYALKQLPGGPTPLLVSLESNGVASADGAPVGSPAKTVHDPAFDLDTQFYADAFTLTVPLRLKPHLPAGPQQVPVSVRFQTCNGRICQPPRTVHLSATVNLQG